MSIPDDIREIRRRQYEASAPRVAEVGQVPRVAEVDHIMEEESLEEILARVATYERDERLAMELDNVRDPSPARMPTPNMVERLIDSYDTPMLHLPLASFNSAITPPNCAATKFWQCAHCSSINLTSNSTFCMFCRNSR